MTILKTAGPVAGLLLLTVLAGCAGRSSTRPGITADPGSDQSRYTPADTPSLHQPVKSADCADAAVLLGVDLDRAREIGRKVLAGLDATVDRQTDTELHAVRERQIGTFQDRGSEALTIRLIAVDGERTFLAATTRLGTLGPVGQKTWSCKIVDQAARLARESPAAQTAASSPAVTGARG